MKVPANIHESSTEKLLNRSEWFLPIVIVLAGLLIAIAIIATRHHVQVTQNGNPTAVTPVNPATDHFLGNPTAPIQIVEYGDIDSEYTKNYQKVMEQIMSQYGQKGDVMWVFREFPLSNIDSNAGEHAEAAECVAALGGNGDFFKFIDAIQTASPGESLFDPSGYDAIVSSIGLSPGTFDSCLKAHTYQKNVADEYKNGLAVGATGAPDTVVIVKGQKPFVIAGEVSYDTMKSVIDMELQKLVSS